MRYKLGIKEEKKQEQITITLCTNWLKANKKMSTPAHAYRSLDTPPTTEQITCHHHVTLAWEAFLRKDWSNTDTVDVAGVRVDRDDRPNILPWISLGDLPIGEEFLMIGAEKEDRLNTIKTIINPDITNAVILPPMDEDLRPGEKIVYRFDNITGRKNKFVCIFEVEVRLLQDIMETAIINSDKKYAWAAEFLLDEISRCLSIYKKYIFMSVQTYNSLTWLLQKMVYENVISRLVAKRFLDLRDAVTPHEFDVDM